jgi:hypothetical protein
MMAMQEEGGWARRTTSTRSKALIAKMLKTQTRLMEEEDYS